MQINASWQQRIYHVLQTVKSEIQPRGVLIFSVLSLLCLGSVMVASASMPYADYIYKNPFYFVERHAISIVAAAIVALAVYQVQIQVWFKNILFLWLVTIAVLLGVLLVGSEVNGSSRWIRVLGFTFQPTELAKIVMAIFTADYVVRRASELRITKSWWGLARLGVVMTFTVMLILAEPDLGATAVIVVMMVGVFFLAGAPLIQFGFLFGSTLACLIALVVFEPYRLVRALSFMNPWSDPLGDGYQLSNALMAFGRGEWWGTGLGYSVQKLSYLPEAHTDFMLAVLAEELGFVGVCTVLVLSFTLIVCIMRIGHRALQNHYLRAGYLAYGIAIIFLSQVFVNAGMNMGLLPTKGLTLPFISYGGTSLMMCAAMVSLVLKIDASTRLQNPKREISSF